MHLCHYYNHYHPFIFTLYLSKPLFNSFLKFFLATCLSLPSSPLNCSLCFFFFLLIIFVVFRFSESLPFAESLFFSSALPLERQIREIYIQHHGQILSPPPDWKNKELQCHLLADIRRTLLRGCLCWMNYCFAHKTGQITTTCSYICEQGSSTRPEDPS